MDASHILVSVLTAVSLGFLVWIEIRSRRNSAVQSAQDSVGAMPETVARPNKRSSRQ